MTSLFRTIRRKTLLMGLSLLLLVGLLTAAFTWICYIEPALYAPTSPSVSQLTVNKGESFNALSRRLEQQGIIPSAFAFKWYGRLTGQARQIKAGHYQLNAESPTNLLSRLVQGDVKQHRFTIIEGSLLKEVIAAMKTHPDIEAEIQHLSEAKLLKALGVSESQKDGFLLPDTYFFPKGTTDKAILLRAKDSLTDFLDGAWISRDKAIDPYIKKPQQAVILASIIEKESAENAERKRIAGVFVERLKRNMRLQSDPTVIYALGDRYKNNNIRKKDLRFDHPINTYRHKGLPPQAIAFAGRASIEAALHPEFTGDVYFVSNGQGQHVFSKTLKQHNAAVRKYILKR